MRRPRPPKKEPLVRLAVLVPGTLWHDVAQACVGGRPPRSMSRYLTEAVVEGLARKLRPPSKHATWKPRRDIQTRVRSPGLPEPPPGPPRRVLRLTSPVLDVPAHEEER